MQNNLHISPTCFQNESRVLKETASLIKSGLVSNVYIVALYEEGLMEHQEIDTHRSVWRVRLKTRNWPRNLVVQLFKYMELCLRVIRYAQAKDVTLVTIHGVSLLPLGLLVKLICNAKLVYDAHELETETFGLCGLRQKASRFVERALIQHVDLIMVVSDGIKEWYRSKYTLSNIVTVLNCPEYQKPQRTKRLHNDLGIPHDKKIVIYQGGLIKGRGVEHLLNSFSEKDDGQHVLVLMGYGELENMIQGYADKYSNIFLQKAVPPEVVLEYTASAYIGVSYIDNPSLNDYHCLPNKFFEYIMAGLPTIVNNAPEMKRVVDEKEIGIVLDELTYRSLAKALEKFSAMNSETLSENLSKAAEYFSWKNQAEVMIEAHRQYVFMHANHGENNC